MPAQSLPSEAVQVMPTFTKQVSWGSGVGDGLILDEPSRKRPQNCSSSFESAVSLVANAPTVEAAIAASALEVNFIVLTRT